MDDSGLSNFDMKMFARAAKVAEQSTYEGYSLGCVIVYNKHIIAESANSNKSHPAQKRYNKYRNFRKSYGKPIQHKGHAEILALTKIPYPLQQQIDWKKVKVYVFRIAKGLPLHQGNSRPCPACLAALKDLGIKDIYYSTDSGYAYERIY